MGVGGFRCDEHGRHLVVCGGPSPAEEGIDHCRVVKVKVARVNDRRVDEAAGEHKRFSGAIAPSLWPGGSPVALMPQVPEDW